MTDQSALLELDVQLEFADYLRFRYYDALRTGWWLLALFILAAGFSAAVVIISAIYRDSYLLRDIVPFGSMILLGGVFLFASPYLTAKREYDVNPGIRQVIHYQLHEDHLAVVAAKKQGKLPWSKISEARELGSCFLLYVSGSSAFILPKHEFPSEAEVMSMRELLTVILGTPKCRFKLGQVTSRF